MSVIKYEGISVVNRIGKIAFSNEHGQKIEVPISEEDAKRIGLYLDRLTTVNRKIVERQNDEPSE
jgi:hypothetical protein